MSTSLSRHDDVPPRGRAPVHILRVAVLVGLTLALIAVIGVGAYLVWQNNQLPASSGANGTATAACIAFAGSHPGTPCPQPQAVEGTATAQNNQLPAFSGANGTATAACIAFAGSHPGTPCPQPQAVEGTATAECNQFMIDNPGTPCP